MKKSVHVGSCQACGREQKLPGEVLSKHGYHVQWRMFVGECPGTGHKPYEQDCSLIQKFIDDMKERLAGVEKGIAENLVPATEPKCWYHEFISGNYGMRSRYEWRQVELIAQLRTYDYGDGNGKCTYYELYYVDYKGKEQRFPERTTHDVLQTATKQNAKYVEWELEPLKRHIEGYIRWQQERVDNWKPVGLKPVPSEAPPDPNRKPRTRRRQR
jgi:hypothetical protein